jgi:GNAT superfamily N-acetyltransferase
MCRTRRIVAAVGQIELIRVEADDVLVRTLRVVEDVFPERALTVDEVKEIEGAFGATRLLALSDREDAGVAYTLADPSKRERNAAFGMVIVRPEHRQKGIGAALLDAATAWARETGFSGWETSIKSDDEESLAWVQRRGFAETGRELRLELDLADVEPPPIDPPDGVEIVTWAERPELARGLYDVHSEASRDIPGEEDQPLESFENWLKHDMGGPGDKPEATFVALVQGEVVGFSKFSLTEAQPTVAFHDLTGVRRAWRGRGIGGALKRTQIAWAKERGYERLSTMNEERNEPIRRLNERYGYRPVPGRIFVRGPVA